MQNSIDEFNYYELVLVVPPDVEFGDPERLIKTLDTKKAILQELMPTLDTSVSIS